MRRLAAGFSLLEVLISIFVLSFGALGAVALQLSAMRTTQQSALQSTAVHLAHDLAEKMRTNHLQSKDANNPYIFSFDSGSASAADPAGCYTQNCDSSALAAADVSEWTSRMAEALPGGRVVVCRDANPYGTSSARWACSDSPDAGITIKIGWRSKNPDGSFVVDDDDTSPPSVVMMVDSYRN